MSSVICRSFARSLLVIRGVALRRLHCKHRVTDLRVLWRGGSFPALRIMRVLMSGADVVFVVVLVPVIPVVPVVLAVAVRPLVGSSAGRSAAARAVGGLPPAVCAAGISTASILG